MQGVYGGVVREICWQQVYLELHQGSFLSKYTPDPHLIVQRRYLVTAIV